LFAPSPRPACHSEANATNKGAQLASRDKIGHRRLQSPARRVPHHPINPSTSLLTHPTERPAL
jgi:hypothetical protein